MELIISILVFLGLLSPDAAITVTQAEVDAIANANQAIVRDVMNDPAACGIGHWTPKDWMEDGSPKLP